MWMDRMANLGTGPRLVLLCLVLVLCAGVVLPVAWWLDGAQGLRASALGGVFCFLGGGAALLVGELLRGPQQVLPHTLATMFLRTSVPLALCAAVYLRRGALADTGLAYYVLTFYLCTLMLETVFETARLQGMASAPRA